MNDPNASLEKALADLEATAESSIQTANALAAQLKRVRKIAHTGAVRDLDKAMEQAQQLASATRDSVAAMRSGWRFDTSGYMESGGFTAELLHVAAESGVTAQEQDGRIVSFPSLVRVLPSDDVVEIDRKRTRDLRPSYIVARLQAAQTRPVKFAAERFLASLLGAYRLVAAAGGRDIGDTVRLVDVYKALTLLPGQAGAYSIAEFTRDIYLLDESRVSETKDGLTLALPAASGTRTGSALRAVTRTGEVKSYYGIAFRQ